MMIITMIWKENGKNGNKKERDAVANMLATASRLFMGAALRACHAIEPCF